MPHIHELYDFTVSAYIVHDGKVLLINHPRYNMWISPGGHIELTEDPEEALFREIDEETGLSVEILSRKLDVESPDTKHIWQPNFIDVHEANAPHKHINFVYFAKATNANAVLSSEHTELKWFSKTELHEPRYTLLPTTIFYAEGALRAASS